MKYLATAFCLLLLSCSGKYDSKDVKEAETLAILLDMSITDVYSDINKALDVWNTMPGEVRNSKNPAKNPFDFNIETGNYSKNIERINKDVGKALALGIPSELEDIIRKFGEIYSAACKELSDPNTTYSKLSEFKAQTEPEYKKLRDELTAIQKEINK